MRHGWRMLWALGGAGMLAWYLLAAGLPAEASSESAGSSVVIGPQGPLVPLHAGVNVLPAAAFTVTPRLDHLKALDVPALDHQLIAVRNYEAAAFQHAHRAGFIDPLAANGKSPPQPPPHEANGLASLVHAFAAVVIPSAASPLPGATHSFDGLANRDYTLPPDTQGAVGRTQYLEVTNFSLQVFDKTGGSLMGPIQAGSLFAPLGPSDVCATHPRGNPVVLYDAPADRWFFSEFAFGLDSHYTPAGPFAQCVAVSRTGDATGAWAVYDFVISNTLLNDYGKFGVWPDAYYGSLRMFDHNQNLIGAAPVAFDRSSMLAAQPATAILNFVNEGVSSTMLPVNLQGSTQPPRGEPATYLALDPANLDDLQAFAFHADFGTPSNSSFTPLAPVATALYGLDLGCKTSGARNTDCVPQPGGAPLLDSMSDRLSFPANYRNFGDHESIVVASTVDVDGTFHAGVRWYELRRTPPGSGNWTAYQQGTQGSSGDSLNRWIGGAAMDQQGNMMLLYNASSSALNPSLYYAGRLASDPLGQLAQGEGSLITGGGQQLYSQDPRWGDYGAIYLDPADDCTFWMAGEYYPASSQNAWRTRIAAVSFPACTSGPTSTPTVSATPTNAPTASLTPTMTSTLLATSTPTLTSTPAATSTPTMTSTPMATSTPTLTSTPAATSTPTWTLTSTPLATTTPTLTSTPLATSTPTMTITPLATSTPTMTITPAATSTPTMSATPTTTATPTANGQGPAIAQDTFQRPNQSEWGTASDGNVWSGDANSATNFNINGNSGVITYGSTNYSSWLGPQISDADLLVTISTSAFDWTNLGVVLRFSDVNNWYKSYIDGNSLVIQKKVNGNTTNLAVTPFAATGNISYSLRFNVTGSVISAKVWPSADSEPTTWMASANDSTFASGYAGIRSLVQNSVTATYTSFVVHGSRALAATSPATYTATASATSSATLTATATAVPTNSPTASATAAATRTASPTSTPTVTATP